MSDQDLARQRAPIASAASGGEGHDLEIRPKLETPGSTQVYSHEFRTKVEKLLADFRAGKK